MSHLADILVFLWFRFIKVFSASGRENLRSLFLGARPVYRFEHSAYLIDQVPFTEKGVKAVLKKTWIPACPLGKHPSRFSRPGQRRQQRERQKGDSFYWQNNNFARTSRFFVHFFAVVARPQRESAQFHVFSRTGTKDNNFPFLFLNFDTVL